MWHHKFWIQPYLSNRVAFLHDKKDKTKIKIFWAEPFSFIWTNLTLQSLDTPHLIKIAFVWQMKKLSELFVLVQFNSSKPLVQPSTPWHTAYIEKQALLNSKSGLNVQQLNGSLVQILAWQSHDHVSFPSKQSVFSCYILSTDQI